MTLWAGPLLLEWGLVRCDRRKTLSVGKMCQARIATRAVLRRESWTA